MLVGIGGFVAFSFSIPVVVSYLLDRRNHDGVDWFKRRRILGSGESASARILSSSMLVGRQTGSKYSAAYSIVYEVMPASRAPFRAKGIEVLYFSEAHANKVDAGSTVQVRFDPSDQTVVLVRMDMDQKRRDDDAQRKAREEALLRGGR